MNTIPSTFNDSLPAYTVVGGAKRNASTGLCAALLNRGGRYARNSYFKELQNSGFDYVLSLEGSGDHFDIEELSAAFPFIRFILFKDAPNIGEQINVAAAESDGPLFFALWNDFHPVLSLDAERIAGRLLLKTPEAPAGMNKPQGIRLCTVPVLQNQQFETLPSASAPVINGKNFETVPFVPVKEGEPSLYPFDAAGVYDRARFIDLGGFDPKIKPPRWQLLDFGLRAWLWGEEIRGTQQIRFKLDGAINAENSTADDNYLRFFLKNLAPVIQSVNTGRKPPKNAILETRPAHLPLRYLPAYLSAANCGLPAAIRNFIDIRGWVDANSRRFVHNINEISAFWDYFEQGNQPKDGIEAPCRRRVFSFAL
ncbi:MAG: hypothetical protein LBC27_02805 [Spirochaetaceae bacterium]|jgi:hypothetical protein|nr:hypothetical protein [Spirochaetaceae bacterium]